MCVKRGKGGRLCPFSAFAPFQSRVLIHSGNITCTVIDWYRGSGDSGRCSSWDFHPIDTRPGTEQTSDLEFCSISSLMRIGAKSQEERLPEVKRIHTTQTYRTISVYPARRQGGWRRGGRTGAPRDGGGDRCCVMGGLLPTASSLPALLALYSRSTRCSLLAPYSLGLTRTLAL